VASVRELWRRFRSAPDDRIAATTIAAGALVAICATVGLGLQFVAGDWVSSFVTGNALGGARRQLLLRTIALGAAGGALAAIAAALWPPRTAGLPRLSRLARLAAPLALMAVVPPLLRSDWSDALSLAALIGVVVVAAQPLWRLHFDAYPLWSGGPARALPLPARRWIERARPWAGRWAPALVIGAMAVGFAAYIGFYAVRKHHRFETFTWDLGQIDNVFFNDLHGNPFRCTPLFREGNWSQLKDHAQFVIYPLLPFYALAPRAETLILIQAVMVAGGGVALYRLAARRLARPVAVTLVAAYYLYPPLHGAVFFDIHMQVVAIPLVLAALDCFDAGRMRWFAVFFALALSCREDIPIGTAVFGLFLIVTGHRPRHGMVIFGVSAIYFVALRFFIMGAGGESGHAALYAGLLADGQGNFAAVVKTMVTNPLFTLKTMLTADKLRYMLQILAPLAFLPLRRRYLLLSLVPGAFFTLLTTDYAPTTDIAYQYSAHFVAYIFPAAALALAAIAKQPDGVAAQRAAVATLIMATIICTVQWGAIPPRHNFRSAYGVVNFSPPTEQQKQWGKDAQDLIASVPRAAILAVTDRELPHASNRVECWNLSVGFAGSDYILYTTDHPAEAERQQVEAAMRAGYTQVGARPGLILLKRPGAP